MITAAGPATAQNAGFVAVTHTHDAACAASPSAPNYGCGRRPLGPGVRTGWVEARLTGRRKSGRAHRTPSRLVSSNRVLHSRRGVPYRTPDGRPPVRAHALLDSQSAASAERYLDMQRQHRYGAAMARGLDRRLGERSDTLLRRARRSGRPCSGAVARSDRLIVLVSVRARTHPLVDPGGCGVAARAR